MKTSNNQYGPIHILPLNNFNIPHSPAQVHVRYVESGNCVLEGMDCVDDSNPGDVFHATVTVTDDGKPP